MGHLLPLSIGMLLVMAGVVAWLLLGTRSLPDGLAFRGDYHPAWGVEFFSDETWVDENGQRQVRQTIFDAVFSMINNAQRLLVLDMFLYNDFQGRQPERTRALAAELTAHLIRQKQRYPDMTIIVITDPVNTVYGGLVSSHFTALQAQGIRVVITNLDPLPDSNPLYSIPWRLLAKPLGNAIAATLPNPFGAGRVSLRSWLKMLNFKANHRKVVIADRGDQYQGLVTSGNPHDGSSAHRNTALQFSGAAAIDLLRTENAVLALSGLPPLALPDRITSPAEPPGPYRLRVLTESRIKQALLESLDKLATGDAIDIMMFYLADRDLIQAIKAAHQRGARIRLILDPNKDAFGWQKNGIPNRQTAMELHDAGIRIRWCDTHGEQCHVKMVLAHFQARAPGQPGTSALILGSANLTRRNLDDLNLETDVQLLAPSDSPVILQASEYVERQWGQRGFTEDYARYADASWWRYWRYRFQEATGLSSF